MGSKHKSLSLYIYLLSATSLIIILNWFNNGYLFATAEEGMPFYSPQRTAYLDSSVWQAEGTGYINTTILARYPTMFFAGILNSLFPANIVQALIFFLVIFAGLTGTFYLSEYFFHKHNISAVSAVFYLLNLFTLSQVFSRALFVFMFVWAFLPWFIFISIKALEEEKRIWFLIFALIQIFFSYSFIFPTSIFVLWIPTGVIFIYKIINNYANKKRFITLLKKSTILVLLWLTLNSWWIYPFIKFANDTTTANSSTESNIELLQAVSNSFPTFQIFQLRQNNYFNSELNPELPWGNYYDSDISHAVSIIGLLIVFIGIYKLRKHKSFVILVLLFFISLFISKGTNSPLGYTFYKWLFNTFYFTGIFRNSYEKFGVVFVLFYSLFFGVGTVAVLDKIKIPNIKILFFGAISLTFFIYLVNPIWSGKVFWDYYWVKVPDYYKEANDFLKEDNSDYRVLILPLVPSHGVRYIWGYRGDEPSRFLFDKAVISRRLGGHYVTSYDEIINNIKNNQNIGSLLQQANIKYIILNRDIDWNAVGASDPDRVYEFLNEHKDIEFVKKYGNLEVFKYSSLLKSSLFSIGDDASDRIDYKEINNRHYKINVYDAEKPFNLVFKETFDKNWTARVNGGLINNHDIIYGYANKWEVNKTGDLNIDIVFKVWPWE